ncbi:MAG: helix-turn-helix domain-containing protein [Actinobacteria bacterium]|nr:MAG: helix-turn-helix domain-containing protein [Actinomycetota bacterium]
MRSDLRSTAWRCEKAARDLPRVRRHGCEDRPMPKRESIGRRLHRLRRERGLSQRDLSSPGVSDGYISRIEAGARTPSVKALRKARRQARRHRRVPRDRKRNARRARRRRGGA